MNVWKIMFFIAVSMLLSSVVFAMHHTPEDRGKALFNDRALGNGSSGKSCNTCHPDGKGLINIGDKKEWRTPAGEHKTLEDAVNTCITVALKGKALDPKSGQMKDLVAYLKSLKNAAVPAKKPSLGC